MKCVRNQIKNKEVKKHLTFDVKQYKIRKRNIEFTSTKVHMLAYVMSLTNVEEDSQSKTNIVVRRGTQGAKRQRNVEQTLTIDCFILPASHRNWQTPHYLPPLNAKLMSCCVLFAFVACLTFEILRFVYVYVTFAPSENRA